MKFARPLFCALLSAFTFLPVAPFSGTAEAATGISATKPLVVIRFNQQHVYYDQQLYDAITQAVAAKPDVVFDVVANAPTTGDASIDGQWVQVASHNTQAVVATMRKFGVPAERMRISGQKQTDLRYDETRIFVR